jgi:hypothetical protein
MHLRACMNIKTFDKNLKAFIIKASLKYKYIAPTYLIDITHTQCQYEDQNNVH